MAYGIFKKFISVLTYKEEGTIKEILKETEVTHNMVGFLGVVGGCGVTNLVCTVGEIIARGTRTVCIVDLDLRMPRVCSYLGAKYPPSGAGILKKLYQPNVDLRELITPTSLDNLKILSASYTDRLLECSDLSEGSILSLFEELSEMFDVVLFDIPRYYELETNLFAILRSSLIYTLFNSDPSCLQNYSKLKEFLFEAGIHNKLNSVIINMALPQLDNSHTRKIKGINVVAELPLCNAVPLNLATGNLIINGKYGINKSARAYIKIAEDLADEILYGIGKN